jgi:threonine/homoserine/homoserine lactone efflux protein
MFPVDPALYALFLGMMAVFAATPGPANVFAIATGARSGPRAALLAVAGMNVASLVWLAAAALGLGALVRADPHVFRVIGVLGGLYVAWLGGRALLAAARDEALSLDSARGAGAGARTAFCEGFVVQLSNPKAVIFFSAVMPPFVDPSRPALPQLALLGLAVIVMDVVAMSGYALAGGALARALMQPKARRAFSAAVGASLLGVAALIVLRR